MTEITGPEALARVAELVEDIDFTMLTTTDPDGNLVSRPMSTRQMDDAGAIWFFTAEDTVKVEEARRHHDVGLAYCDAKGMRYVSVAGTAEIVHDRAKMEELYSPPSTSGSRTAWGPRASRCSKSLRSSPSSGSPRRARSRWPPGRSRRS